MKLNKTQIVVISGSLLLIVLLLFANTKLLPKKEEAPVAEAAHDHTETASFDQMAQSYIAGLKDGEKKKFLELETAIQSSGDKKMAYEQMIHMWDSLRNPSLAAYYMEQSSIVSPTESNWSETANRYYAATRFMDENIRPMLYKKAMEGFEKVIQLNPKNVEAKISLAACYVEGSADPMKGIGMLREIEKTDSNNVNLQLNFAFFSEKSGQWDRALKRFEKVLKIQPDYIEVYLHMADAYQQKGEPEKAIESLKKYVSLVDDPTIKTEVQEYINKLTGELNTGKKQ